MSLESHVGQFLTVSGVAVDVLAGAIVMTDDGEGVFVSGHEAWAPEVNGKRIEARGILRRKKLGPDPQVEDGVHVGGMQGTQLVLESATWRITS